MYPFTDKQVKLIDGKPYVQSDRLLLGLGVIDSSDLKLYKPNHHSYLSVIKVAKSLGYKVKWDEEKKVVSLEKILVKTIPAMMKTETLLQIKWDKSSLVEGRSERV